MRSMIFSLLLVVGVLIVGCAPPRAVPTLAPTSIPTPISTPLTTSRADGLSEQQAATLDSLKKVDDHPLYTMRYYGAYDQRLASGDGINLSVAVQHESPRSWACSLFAAFGDAGNMLYGRNFDWDFSPAVLLFTEPPDGYASVSMVDVAYIGFAGSKSRNIADLPLAERRDLLRAPLLPFDGMNARGLAIGMAAVPPGNVKPDPNKETIDSLGIIRKMLDYAANVDEAIAIMQRYNVDMGSGPPVHYLIADASGRAALVEYYQGKLMVIPNDKPWHQATNFLRSSVQDAAGQCRRYDTITQQLAKAEGRTRLQDAMGLLRAVSQESTEWSIVYGMSTGEINVAMGRRYDNTHTFQLKLVGK